MIDPFTEATRAAINEILENHMEKSKYGYFVSEDKLEDITDDIFSLLKTSRSLKSAGDRFMAGAIPQQTSKQPAKKRSTLPWRK